ncbi:MAG: hypothetical protein BM485_10895 [Desulfobulbaceae bacterium DB1]|nr:MAG: hypothetical protein BM485_10895 [Desulfobulbaceae bacterium DB1]
MARKKASRKKKGKNGFYWTGLLFFLSASLIATFYFVFLRPGTFDRTMQSREEAGGAKPPAVHEEPQAPSVLAPLPYKKTEHKAGPADIALIIDDMGYKDRIGRELISLDLNLSFAFLPFAPHTPDLAHLAHDRGRDILLHLPMEARDSSRQPGPGALLTSMSDREMTASLEKDIQAVPFALGVNNHMGSRFTADPRAMKTCLLLLKKRNLFFLDSLTAADSVAYRTAEDAGLPTARRDVFLDHDPSPAAIARQLDLLIKTAEKNGSAIGIGHPHPETLSVLRQHAESLRDRVRLVGVSRLVR